MTKINVYRHMSTDKEIVIEIMTTISYLHFGNGLDIANFMAHSENWVLIASHEFGNEMDTMVSAALILLAIN